MIDGVNLLIDTNMCCGGSGQYKSSWEGSDGINMI